MVASAPRCPRRERHGDVRPSRDHGDEGSVRERELRWRTWRGECWRVWSQPQVLQDAVDDGVAGEVSRGPAQRDRKDPVGPFKGDPAIRRRREPRVGSAACRS